MLELRTTKRCIDTRIKYPKTSFSTAEGPDSGYINEANHSQQQFICPSKYGKSQHDLGLHQVVRNQHHYQPHLGCIMHSLGRHGLSLHHLAARHSKWSPVQPALHRSQRMTHSESASNIWGIWPTGRGQHHEADHQYHQKCSADSQDEIFIHIS